MKTMTDLLPYLLFIIAMLTGSTRSQDTCETRALQSRLNDLERKFSALEAETEQKLEDYRQEVKTGNRDTLFFAVISVGTVTLANRQIVPWDSAPINPGGHFSTGAYGYTAPVDGYYQFSINLRSTGRATCWLMVNSERLLLLADEPNDDSAASSTANLKLNKDDLVQVQKHVEAAVAGSRNVEGQDYIGSWFTGQLLYAL